MSSLGIQALMLPLAGLHSALTHHELMGMLEFARILGNSYRLASSETRFKPSLWSLRPQLRWAVVAGAAR
jgi:hypothetical protein